MGLFPTTYGAGNPTDGTWSTNDAVEYRFTITLADDNAANGGTSPKTADAFRSRGKRRTSNKTDLRAGEDGVATPSAAPSHTRGNEGHDAGARHRVGPRNRVRADRRHREREPDVRDVGDGDVRRDGDGGPRGEPGGTKAAANTRLNWTPSTLATDTAGNAASATAVDESGPLDTDL
jgi:hypothetical protein